MTSNTLLLVLCFITLGMGGCRDTGSGLTDSQSKKQTQYEDILASGKIRVGYISYPPSYIVSSDGTQSGIFHDVMEEIGKNLGLKIEYTKEVTWDGMIQDILDNKIDMVVTGIWPTTQRGKQVDFADPLFYSVVKAYTSAGNTAFDNNPSAINSDKVKIAAIDGEMTSIIASMDFPKATQVSVTQLTGVAQALLEVQSKKADVTFVEPVIALDFLASNPGSIKEVVGMEPLRVFPNSMMLRKDSEAFKSTLNVAIRELINNGFVNRVIDKYETYPGSFYRVQVPYQKQ